MSWLEEHVDGFVLPHLILMREGGQLSPSAVSASIQIPLNPFTPEELTVIKNTWRSVKKAAKDKTILLAGRDVFIFEILAKREGYPTVFMPECSRMTARHLKIPNVDDFFLFDTGFIGSIPRGLGIKDFSLMSYAQNKWADGINPTVQVFPRLTHSRGLALKIEQTPKYWESGRLGIDDEIVQPVSKIAEFVNAARLTISIYKSSSPKFISGQKPIGAGEGRWW